MTGEPFRVFYSYSHADIRMLERLRTHMAMLRREGLITEWYDREIEAGSQWREEIERELEAADVILLLVSADFLNSDFCYQEEMARAVERAHRGEVLLIGAMLRPVEGWQGTPFAGFQLVPRDARPISKWSNQDEAYSDVVERIRAALEERATARSQRRPKARRSSKQASPRATTDRSAQPAKRPEAAPPAHEDLSPAELAMLERIADPEQRELQRLQIRMQKEAFEAQMTTNMRDMSRDIRRAVAQNFRADDTTDERKRDS